MLSKCVIDFLKKYKKYIFVSCIVFLLILIWQFNKRQENADVLSSNADKKSDMTIGMFFSYCCTTILFGCMLPWCIMYFITKKSAIAAIKSTPCRTIVAESVVASS